MKKEEEQKRQEEERRKEEELRRKEEEKRRKEEEERKKKEEREKRKKRPSIGIYQPPSLIRHKQQAESGEDAEGTHGMSFAL